MSKNNSCSMIPGTGITGMKDKVGGGVLVYARGTPPNLLLLFLP
jgi:hypothetical protein